jgi:hypothetical protein
VRRHCQFAARLTASKAWKVLHGPEPLLVFAVWKLPLRDVEYPSRRVLEWQVVREHPMEVTHDAVSSGSVVAWIGRRGLAAHDDLLRRGPYRLDLIQDEESEPLPVSSDDEANGRRVGVELVALCADADVGVLHELARAMESLSDLLLHLRRDLPAGRVFEVEGADGEIGDLGKQARAPLPPLRK